MRNNIYLKKQKDQNKQKFTSRKREITNIYKTKRR